MNPLHSKPSFQRFIMLVLLAALLGKALGSTPAYAAALIVTNTNDSGAGSLRAVIAGAGSGDTITFDAALSGATIHLASTLILNKNVTIDGSTLDTQITISGDTDSDGSGDVRVFIVNGGAISTLSSLVITKGWTTSNGPGGGGIYNVDGTLTILNSTISDSVSAFGGGIFSAGGTLTVIGSTLTGNSSTNSAGGMGIIDSAATITNSTFSGNSATSLGGGMRIASSSATVIIANSTFSGNAAIYGTSIDNFGSLTLTNSTLAGNATSAISGDLYNKGMLNYANNIIANSTGGDCRNDGTIGTNINNLVRNGSCAAALSGDPMLGALSGTPQTFLLLAGSPAIDAGDDTTCAAAPVSGIDQHGTMRPVGAHCDIGAYEYESALIVTSNADTDDSICDAADCTLREAIDAANTNSGADIIHFANSYTIMLGSALPDINGDLKIDGEANAIVIDGNGQSVLSTNTGIKLTVSNLTIQNGHGSDGGAILSRGPLTVTNSIFSGNSATNNAGAIYNYQGTSTIVTAHLAITRL